MTLEPCMLNFAGAHPSMVPKTPWWVPTSLETATGDFHHSCQSSHVSASFIEYLAFTYVRLQASNIIASMSG